jgi:hypothetical protein
MLTTSANALALMRFDGGHGGGFILTLLGLVVIGALVWALTRPDRQESAKN